MPICHLHMSQNVLCIKEQNEECPKHSAYVEGVTNTQGTKKRENYKITSMEKTKVNKDSQTNRQM